MPLALPPNCLASAASEFARAVFHELRGLMLSPGLSVPPDPVPAGITMRAAIDELLAAKRAANRRPVYLRSLGFYLNQFAAGRDTKPLAEFSTASVEQWMQRYASPESRQTWLNRLSTLFSFAVRRGHLTANPCARIERVTVERVPPLVLTPEQAEKLLRVTPPRMRAHVVLGLFAGIRPGELAKLTWDAVCLDTKSVRVDLAKTRRRRIVPLEPCAVALLAALPERTGDISPPEISVRRWKRRAAKALRFGRWPQDLLRHTAASYLLALLGDAGKVAARLGNSSAILLTHYHQPVKQADCERFWQLSTWPRYRTVKRKRKHNRAAVRAFYEDCRSYKLTREKFGISSAGTLHYLLKGSRAPSAPVDESAKAVTHQAEPVREAA